MALAFIGEIFLLLWLCRDWKTCVTLWKLASWHGGPDGTEEARRGPLWAACLLLIFFLTNGFANLFLMLNAFESGATVFETIFYTLALVIIAELDEKVVPIFDKRSNDSLKSAQAASRAHRLDLVMSDPLARKGAQRRLEQARKDMDGKTWVERRVKWLERQYGFTYRQWLKLLVLLLISSFVVGVGFMYLFGFLALNLSGYSFDDSLVSAIVFGTPYIFAD